MAFKRLGGAPVGVGSGVGVGIGAGVGGFLLVEVSRIEIVDDEAMTEELKIKLYNSGSEPVRVSEGEPLCHVTVHSSCSPLKGEAVARGGAKDGSRDAGKCTCTYGGLIRERRRRAVAPGTVPGTQGGAHVPSVGS